CEPCGNAARRGGQRRCFSQYQRPSCWTAWLGGRNSWHAWQRTMVVSRPLRVDGGCGRRWRRYHQMARPMMARMIRSLLMAEVSVQRAEGACGRRTYTLASCQYICLAGGFRRELASSEFCGDIGAGV